ncbi:Hypothetical predicted protein [Paramuricea clavata]|uniref:Reverse transcriptase domain-containing protein n=1 Tax=Paramuricea clavata TaxID=317549 RepID=A0A6S7G2W8_PARCT|nr:Hypothetical predicted protein [Paramuricea clavata]
MILANEPVELDNKLSEWLPGTGTWRICWRGTEHGFAAPIFHEKCNEKKPSLVIVKVVTGDKSLIFGGYCTATWAGESTDIVRKTDAVKKQQSELRNKADFPVNGVDSIRSAKHKKSRRDENNKATGKSNQKDFPGKQSCFRCGKNLFHSREKCPARNSTGNKCSKLDIGLKSAELKWSRRWSKKTKTKFVETVKTCSDEVEPRKKWKRQSPKLFKGIKNEYTIKLKSDAKPHAVYTPRKIAHPRLPKVKNELDSWMEKMGVISKIGTPTEWCSHMVVVPNSNGDIRICIDPSKLNESILREAHHQPSVDYTLAKFVGSTVCPKLDCNSGFWQIPLSEESAPITTFITQWRRYHLNVRPFGITPASEHFTKQLEMILKDCERVCIEIDDILVHGEDTEEHDERLKKVLQKLEEANVTLNGDKCEFSKPELHYLGHVINDTGINADPGYHRDVIAKQHPRGEVVLRNVQPAHQVLIGIS